MTMDLMFLNENEVQSFIENGYTIAKGVFPASLAERAVNELWDAMPEDRNDPNTWNRPGFLLQHSMRDSVYPELFTDKLKSPFRTSWAKIAGPRQGDWNITRSSFPIANIPGHSLPVAGMWTAIPSGDQSSNTSKFFIIKSFILT